MTDFNKSILFFDGVCNLCNGLVVFLIRRDPHHRLKFVAIQSKLGQELLRSHKSYSDRIDTVILIKNDILYIKSTAVLQLLKELGGIWKLTYIFIIIPSSWRDFIYDLIARHRYNIFGKRDKCMIPSPEIANRFLD